MMGATAFIISQWAIIMIALVLAVDLMDAETRIQERWERWRKTVGKEI